MSDKPRGEERKEAGPAPTSSFPMAGLYVNTGPGSGDVMKLAYVRPPAGKDGLDLPLLRRGESRTDGKGVPVPGLTPEELGLDERVPL